MAGRGIALQRAGEVNHAFVFVMLYVTHNSDYADAMAATAIHPGKHLAAELNELGMSAAELARQLEVPTNRITEIINGRRGITGDTALRLAHFFGTAAEFWLNLQSLYEIRIAQKRLGKSIKALPTLKRFEQAHA